MRLKYKLPKDREQYNDKAPIMQNFKRSTKLTQFISFLSQGVLYYLLIRYQLNHLSPWLAIVIAGIVALFLSLTLEVGQAVVYPVCARLCIRKESWRGLELAFTVFTLIASLVLLSLSILSSVVTVEDGLRITTGVTEKNTEKEYDQYLTERLFHINNFSADSTTIAATWEDRKRATEKLFKSKIEKNTERIRQYTETENRTGRKYTTRKNRLENENRAISVALADSLFAYENRKTHMISAKMNRKEKVLGDLTEKYNLTETAISDYNEQLAAKTENRIGRWSFLGSALVIFCCLWLAIVSVLDEIAKKLAKMEVDVEIEQDFDLRPNPLSDLVSALGNSLVGKVRNVETSVRSKYTNVAEPEEKSTLIDDQRCQPIEVIVDEDEEGSSTTVIQKKRKRKTRSKANTIRVSEKSSLQEIRREVDRIGGNYRTWKSRYDKDPSAHNKARMEEFEKLYSQVCQLRDAKRKK